jgi:hypothetical protein
MLCYDQTVQVHRSGHGVRELQSDLEEQSEEVAMAANAHSIAPSRITINFHSLRTVTAPEDQDAGRKRYCGIVPATELLKVPTDENVRGYLGEDADGQRRKSTLVNMAIRNTLAENRDLFPLLNAGAVVVARKAEVEDSKRQLILHRASIINGAQTQGVLEEFFENSPDQDGCPSVNLELIVTDDEELIADISIARNFQNRVADLSIYGRQKLFDELEAAIQRHDPSAKLRKTETNFGVDYLDTEKLIQVLTALAPQDVRLPSAEARKVKTPETVYRVYAYRHRSRCLKDYATVMDDPANWQDAHDLFLDLAWSAWELYKKLRKEQAFSSLHKVQGESVSGKKVVSPEGVPDGIVFPMLSALSQFVRRTRGGWRIEVPKTFPWKTLFNQAMVQVKTTAGHNPQTMGKNADCYVALHGAIEMYFAVMSNE